MEFQIDPSCRLPIYRQLAQQLREAVAHVKLGGGVDAVKSIARGASCWRASGSSCCSTKALSKSSTNWSRTGAGISAWSSKSFPATDL